MRSIGVLVEARRLDGELEQVQRLVALIGQQAHRPIDGIIIGDEAHFRPDIVQRHLEGFAVQLARAFVEQGQSSDWPGLPCPRGLA
jgi:hypothetical protein